MKHLMLILSVAAFGSIANAAKRISCNVQTLQDAERCMEKVADTRQSYEDPNEGFATDEVKRMARTLEILGLKDKYIKAATDADFAGIMIENGDENHVYYFAIKKGRNVSPKQLYDLNTVDFEYELTKPYSAEELNPDTYFLGLAKKSPAYSDAAERLDYLR